MTETERNEVFLQSQTIREQTFRTWLDGKDIEVPDAGVLEGMDAQIKTNKNDINILKNHNHNDVYASRNHNHDDVYAQKNHSHNTTYSPLIHNHDDIYSLRSHTHNELYATNIHSHDDVYSVKNHKHDELYATNTHNHDNLYGRKSKEHEHNNISTLNKITEDKLTFWNNKSEFTGSYNDLTNKPTIPSIDGLAHQNWVVEQIQGIDLSGYQLKNDETLNTKSKTVVGGINENREVIHSIRDSYGARIEGCENTINSIPNNYQTKTDNNLNTSSKQVVGAINELKALVPNFITNSDMTVVSGGSGGTSYRFPNGMQINIMQIWGTWNITTAWGSVWSSPYIAPSNYIQTFLTPPQVSITAHGAGTAIMVCQAGAPTTTTPGSYYLWKPVQQTGVKNYIEIISIGKWK